MPNIAPQITSITFDKPSYIKGQLMTATVEYVPGMSEVSESITVSGTDQTTGLPGQLSVGFTTMAPDPTTVSASDSGNRTWTQTSETGSAAVFTATA